MLENKIKMKIYLKKMCKTCRNLQIKKYINKLKSALSTKNDKFSEIFQNERKY